MQRSSLQICRRRHAISASNIVWITGYQIYAKEKTGKFHAGGTIVIFQALPNVFFGKYWEPCIYGLKVREYCRRHTVSIRSKNGEDLACNICGSCVSI